MPSPSLQLRAKIVGKPAEGEEADPAFAPAPARRRLWSSGSLHHWITGFRGSGFHSEFDTDIDEPKPDSLLWACFMHLFPPHPCLPLESGMALRARSSQQSVGPGVVPLALQTHDVAFNNARLPDEPQLGYCSILAASQRSGKLRRQSLALLDQGSAPDLANKGWDRDC
ncbi:uncharacterized protein FTOL_03461 [Fusarium torulosum]|uniref:Uncharacterized protein n=1 Tax=Fusarium torulosum TaxID=33205 RepID=A0AAE8M3L7_9HYPO|nr:uncharacterized protein FTOL_03461 [Fusarium torulosum]